jgi:hypothetical protein
MEGQVYNVRLAAVACLERRRTPSFRSKRNGGRVRVFRAYIQKTINTPSRIVESQDGEN